MEVEAFDCRDCWTFKDQNGQKRKEKWSSMNHGLVLHCGLKESLVILEKLGCFVAM